MSTIFAYAPLRTSFRNYFVRVVLLHFLSLSLCLFLRPVPPSFQTSKWDSFLWALFGRLFAVSERTRRAEEQLCEKTGETKKKTSSTVVLLASRRRHDGTICRASNKYSNRVDCSLIHKYGETEFSPRLLRFSQPASAALRESSLSGT